MVTSAPMDSIKEIAEFISERMGVSVVNEPPRPGEVPEFVLDTSLIRSLGFESKIGFWRGLGEYLKAWPGPR